MESSIYFIYVALRGY